MFHKIIFQSNTIILVITVLTEDIRTAVQLYHTQYLLFGGHTTNTIYTLSHCDVPRDREYIVVMQ